MRFLISILFPIFIFITICDGQNSFRKKDLKLFLKDQNYLTSDKKFVFLLHNNVCGSLCGKDLRDFLTRNFQNDSTPKVFVLSFNDSNLISTIKLQIPCSTVQIYDWNELGKYDLYGSDHLFIKIRKKRFNYFRF